MWSHMKWEDILPLEGYHAIEVYNNGTYIGKVTDVYQGAQAIIGVDVNGKKVMIPYIDAFVKNKDIEHKRIDVSLIGGFLDED